MNRRYVKTTEFTGKLEINDKPFQDNVKCVYEDDYFSNRIMKGKFYVDYLSADFQMSFKHSLRFTFEDKSGRILKGTINGYNLKDEFNERWNVLSFNLDEYTQWLRFPNDNPKIVRIDYFVSYISLFSRGLRCSFGYDDSFLLKYTSPIIKFCVNQICVEFIDRSYLIEDMKPDSKFIREVVPRIVTREFDYNDISKVLEDYASFITDLFALVSFILNFRVNYYGYRAEFLDENEKLTEFILRKYSGYDIGNDFTKEHVNRDFEKYFTESNIASLLGTYRSIIQKDDQIRRILFSYISIKELSSFESKFLSAYSTLEGISKLIVKPQKRLSCEDLIKKALNVAAVGLQEMNFEVSRIRKNNPESKLEWEITEYRNYLTHFNQSKFDFEIMVKEFRKIMKLNRILIFYYMSPRLKDWPEP